TSFQYDDESQPRKKKELDFAHLNATDLTLQARSFVMDDDSITASIQQVAFKEQSGLTLQRLQGDVVYTDKKMYADKLLVQTPGTRIKHTIHLDYPSLESIQKDIGSLQVQAILPDCYVSNKDILFFVPALRSQPALSDPSSVFRINANVKGRVNNLTANTLQIQGWQNTKLDVSGTVVGLPSVEKLYGDIRINEIRTTRADAARFLPEAVRRQVEVPATLQLSGTVKGNGNQMRTNVQLKSSSGNIALNGTMANYQNVKAAVYNMQVQVQGVQAGAILKNPSLQGVSANMQVQGKGLTPETADATLKGTVASVGFQKYNYRNINLDAAIKDQQAKGNVTIADENIRMAGNISVNLALADPALLADVMVDSIKTKPLNLTTDELVYRGKINADLASINPDSLQGTIDIIHSLLVTNNERLQLDTLHIEANTSPDSSRLLLESDIAKARLVGKYKLTQLGDIFMQAIQPYFSVIAPAKPSSAAKATKMPAPYNFRLGLYVKDNPALKVFMPALQQFETLRLRARFSSDSGWQANAQLPVLVMNAINVNNLQLDASARDSSLNATTTVGSLQFGGNTVYNALLKAHVANNRIDFLTRVHDQGGRIQYSIPGMLQQPSNGVYDISLKSDSLLLNYDVWTVAPDNVIHLADNDLRVTNFMLNHNFQQFSLKSRGNMLNAPTEASFTSFQISTLAAFVTSDSLGVDGTLDGQVLLYNLTTQPLFSGDVIVTNLNFKGDTVGNVIVKAKNTTADIINANVELTGRGNHATVNGDFYVKPVSGNDFKFKVALDTLNLASIEGATMGAIRDSKGSITGDFNIAGSFAKPNIDGGLNFKRTSFNLSMLNSYFSIEDERIAVNNEGIRFDSFTIEDSAKHKAVIDGMVYTTDFKKYKFDLSVRANDFQAMNSTKAQNRLYYGQLIFSSNMHLKGTADKPVIDGNITIGDKTNVTAVLPQQDPSVVKRDGIVQFVDMDAPENDTLFMNMQAGYDSLNKAGLTGLDISANVEIK
ncbi:MAG TPA: translocation/assembly module TamB domain-containing protein, partial [Niastella sp.]|nr:translocation/assembly module TamB domain-containing protein [Niastella sp.]